MSEERSIYDFGNAGISMLQQEIIKRDAENAQLLQRAELAEALALTLRAALEQIQNILDRGQEMGADDVPIYALTDIVNPVLIEHPGASLLAELAAAQALRAACHPLGSMAQLDKACAAYDAAVKARAE